MRTDELEKARYSRTLRQEPDRRPSNEGSPRFIGRVTTPQAQIQVGSYLMLQPTRVFGVTSENGVPTFTDTTTPTVPAVLLGPALANTGDHLIAYRVNNRWAVERTTPGVGGGPGNNIPGCSCTNLPKTLKMTSFNAACNFKMFQSGTLTFGPPPAPYSALDLGGNLYVGDQTFPDPLANNSQFRYILTCHYNQFNLSRIYATTPFGSPFRDGILYTWLIGGYGNTCHPFHLDNGVPYAGSDASCNVQIDE